MTRGLWLKVLCVSVFLVACEPFNPYGGKCPAIDPPCSQRNYSLHLLNGSWPYSSEESNRVDSLRFSVNFLSTSTSATALAKSAKTTLSCVSCEGYFVPDSVYFTTEIVTKTGDILPKGYNFVAQTAPAGISFYNSAWIGVDSIMGFLDSVFQVRFVGTVEGVSKSASLTIHIAHPSLIVP